MVNNVAFIIDLFFDGQLMKNMSSAEYISSILSEIDGERTHDTSYYQPSFSVAKEAGTSHMSVLAPDGSAVSITTTINHEWVPCLY